MRLEHRWVARLALLFCLASRGDAFARARAQPRGAPATELRSIALQATKDPRNANAYEGRPGPRRAGFALLAVVVVFNVALTTADPATKHASQDPYGLCTPLCLDEARGAARGLNSEGGPCMPGDEFLRRLFLR